MMPTIQGIILLIAMASICNAYYPDLKDPYVPDSVLKDLVDFMSKDIMEDASEEYEESEQLPLSNARLALMARATKDQGERFMDYDSLLDRTNPHPSIRDQEYLQHSSLWGHQFMSGGAAEVPSQRLIKPQVKTDATLPAYCDPPNPCPVGVTEDEGCITDFENTASFSREYQSSQECMCDAEHMFECPSNNVQDENEGQQKFNAFFARQFPQDHKSLVAKKFHAKKSSNPFLDGPKLPIAAKKGFNVN